MDGSGFTDAMNTRRKSGIEILEEVHLGRGSLRAFGEVLGS